MLHKWFKPLLCAALTACLSFTATAQDVKPEDMAQAMTDNLSFLQLTDQQTTNVMALNKTAAQSLIQLAQKAKTDTTFKGKPLLQQVMGVMKKRNTGLSKVLSPNQLDAFQVHRIEQMADLQTRMMIVQLDLTDDQIPQVYDLNLAEAGNMIGDVENIQDSKNKWQKAKAGKTLKKDIKDKDEAMKQILSPNQYTVYEQNKAAIIAALKEKKK
jgi:hypothetical protein